jgi:transposase-like protein
MGKKRVYRHDIKCPECGSNWVSKNGHQTNGKQKYRCNDCNRTFTENPERVYLTKDEKDKIISMFSEGNTQSAIARIMGKSYNTIHSLIYREGKKAKKKNRKKDRENKREKSKSNKY